MFDLVIGGEVVATVKDIRTSVLVARTLAKNFGKKCFVLDNSGVIARLSPDPISQAEMTQEEWNAWLHAGGFVKQDCPPYHR